MAGQSIIEFINKKSTFLIGRVRLGSEKITLTQVIFYEEEEPVIHLISA